MISYCITACNEHIELKTLLYQLQGYLKDEDEIIIQLDGNFTDQVLSVTTLFCAYEKRATFITFRLNNDFASFKNNLLLHAKNKWIFQIDADELISDFLLENIHYITDENPEVEAFALPRVNIVNGLTPEWATKWRWSVSRGIVDIDDEYTNNLLKEYGIYNGDLRLINYPDYQVRLFQNTGKIKWRNKVHEVLYKEDSNLEVVPFPCHDNNKILYEYCIFHVKDIDRQIKQNELYSRIDD